MELIDRYVYAVTRALPKSQRADVEKTLRSDIHDMVEAEKGTEEQRVRKTLETLGRPETLAMNYSGTKQYLISPQWYGTYIDALKKVSFIVVPIIFIISVLSQTLDGNGAVMQRIIEVIINTVGSAIQVAFWTTAVFVFLEHTKSRAFEKDKEKLLAWSVDQLPQLVPDRESKLSDCIANIVFYSALIVVTLLTKNVLGFDVHGTNVSFFNPDLWSFWLWAILATLVGLIAKEIYTFKKGRETAGSIWAKIAFDGALFAMLLGLHLKDMLINPAFAEKTKGIWIGDASLEWIVGATLALWGAGFVWDSAKSILKLNNLTK